VAFVLELQRGFNIVRNTTPAIKPGDTLFLICLTPLSQVEVAINSIPAALFPWLLICWTLRTLGSTVCPHSYLRLLYYFNLPSSIPPIVLLPTVKDVILSYGSDDSHSLDFMPSRRRATTQCASWTDDAPYEEISSSSYREGMGCLGEVSSGRARSEVWEYETRTTGNRNEPVRLVSLPPRHN